MRLALLPVGLWFGIAPAPQASAPQSQTADQLLDKAVQTYSALKTTKGTLQQTVRNALTGSVLTSRAAFQQEFPSRFSLRFTSPPGEAIVSDGTTAWLYLPSTAPGRAGRCAAAALPVSPAKLISEFVNAPRLRFDITEGKRETVAGRPTRMLTLVPKGSHPIFRKASAWIDEETGLIRQFETDENIGVVRRVVFVTLETNVPVDAGQFTFTAPSGVKVQQGCS